MRVLLCFGGRVGDEAVSSPSYCEKVGWVFGIFFKDTSESHEEVVDSPCVDVGRDLPDLFEDFLSADDFVGVLDKKVEQLKLKRC